MTALKLQSDWGVQIPSPGPRIVSKFTPFSSQRMGSGHDTTQAQGTGPTVSSPDPTLCERKRGLRAGNKTTEPLQHGANVAHYICNAPATFERLMLLRKFLLVYHSQSASSTWTTSLSQAAHLKITSRICGWCYSEVEVLSNEMQSIPVQGEISWTHCQ